MASSMASSGEYDLNFLKAGADSLQEYLLSDEVYWPIGIRPPTGQLAYPQLTLSAVLLAQAGAHARDLTPVQQSELANLDEQLDLLRNRWRVKWEKKATREFHARLILWRDFLEEYRENPESQAGRYAYEVRRRVMLHYLREDAAEAPPAELELLNALDKLLRAVFVSGPFVWEPELQTSFPQTPYWYLYGALQKTAAR
jgi:hypothetical protein